MAWQHPARPARHGTARHAAGRPFRPSGCRRAVENSGPGPAALTRSLFTEPVTSSSFRCRLNLGGMIPAGGGGREERLEVGYSPSAGCGPGRRQMAAATGAGLRHRAAPPSAERSTAGGGVACGWGRGLSVWAWSVGVGVVSGMPLGGGGRERCPACRAPPPPLAQERPTFRSQGEISTSRPPVRPCLAPLGAPPPASSARPLPLKSALWGTPPPGCRTTPSCRRAPLEQHRHGGQCGEHPWRRGMERRSAPPPRGTRGPLGVSAAPAPASPPRRSPGTRPRKYFGLGHRTLPELCQRAARGEHGDLEGSRGPIKAGGLRGVVRGTMPGAWLPLLLAGGLALSARGDPAALLRRDNDASGRCTYSFTVASPGEVSCPEAGSVAQLREELAALAARLSRLEGAGGVGGSGPRGADVSGAWSRGPQRAAPGGCEELQRAKERLEEEKGRLEREKEELGRRLESSAQEIARLRAARCPSGTGGVPGRDALRSASKGQCWGMGIRGHPLLAPNPTSSPRYRVPLSPPPTLLPVPPPGASAFAP